MSTTTDYRANSRSMMAQSHAELARGDRQQASEKGWGAAAQMMKAVAETRGWEHGRHRHFLRIASHLRAETGDREIYLLFGSASLLHENFYEDQMAVQDIDEALHNVERLLEKLEAVLSA